MAIGGTRAAAEPVRRQAGRYVLGELLGRGGMAEVFSGHSMGDHGFQKPVAIKRLLPELASDHVFVDRLIDEAKLLVGMQHGNIVSVIDLARDGDDVFLVMEFVDGPSLRQLLKAMPAAANRPRHLPVGVATYVVQAAAAGLAFAHDRPGGAIIHADISPSNLLLTTSGEVRVADFGIARREGGLLGIVEGKWAYMAPEQARGEELTPASDVFALGVVLYELICGSHPLGLRVTADERERQPLRVIPPRVVNPAVPVGLEAICLRALASNPSHRYASMQQLIEALVEERFANQWREGASDLAAMIRAMQPEMAAQHRLPTAADRPLTIATRSLLPSRLAETVLGKGSSSVSVSAASAALPSQAFAVGTHHERAVPIAEAPMEPARRNWALPIVGLAAVVGIVAAIGIQLAPADDATLLAMTSMTSRTSRTSRTSAAPAAASLAAEAVEPAAAPAAPAPTRPTVPEVTPALALPAAPAPVTTTAPVKRPAPAPARKRVDGTLRLKSYPWAWAYINGKKIEAPAKLTLAEGKYTVKFQNPENGKLVYRTVIVDGGKLATAAVNWEDEE